jgi:hypothetical protein
MHLVQRAKEWICAWRVLHAEWRVLHITTMLNGLHLTHVQRESILCCQ